MAVTVIALVTINEDEPMALARYMAVSEPLLKAAGARIVQRFKFVEPVVGRSPAQTLIIVEYPSRAAVDTVFASEEYTRLIPFRDAAFAEYRVSIVTNDGLVPLGDTAEDGGATTS